ncbi:hypothetical protein [Paenibacillus durus]|uniref:Uncharacterized protein n=1 Tax=Paenibacillus durus TaxID=44251 RepID=A0A089HVY0_PAEDU|nr:hypothetical protein [Paenibacillus durus]AIQ15262.1 hypothetical protein PDUR_27930 [Paenibacillus durus]
MSIDKLLEWAKTEAVKLVNRLQHTDEEKRLIATGYMMGFCDGILINGQARKTEQSGENGRT